ncbi:MAG: gliding motility-associated protein GldE [Bacteroidetes bacterium]|nr:MAG: gliding motility-associated protein GldE [Bacteroidota bacterium]
MESEPDHRLFLFPPVLFPLFAWPDFGVLAAIGVVLLLLYASAMVSGSEIAFFSLTHNDFARLREDESVSARLILQLQQAPRTLLATILISNNLINVAIAILSEYVIRTLFPDSVFQVWGEQIARSLPVGEASVEGLSAGIRFTIVVVGVTFLLVLFGEVAPKIYAKLNNERLAKRMARPLWFLVALFRPLSTLLVRGTNFIEQRLESKRHNEPGPSKEDIDEAIELAVSGEEKAARHEIDILKSIVKFGDLTVKQIMRNRVDVVAVDVETPFPELLDVIRESGYSRIPVYKDDFDHVVGILYAKDLLGHLEEKEDFTWQQLIRDNVYFVPETKKIRDLLKEFQSQRMHMAIVVDEYGGTSGIVTLEDVLEEVIGEIRDEFDDEVEVEYQKLDDRNYVFEGKTLLTDVCRILGLSTDTFEKVRRDADSLAGLVIELAGFLPKKDFEVRYLNFKFKILAASKKRVEKVQITLLD